MEAATVAAARRGAGRAGDRRSRGEIAAYALLVAVALVLRLCDLGDRPFHHDESQDAYFSWVFFTEGDYEYKPILHGPLRFYLTAAMYALFGDSDFTARLAPALMGDADGGAAVPAARAARARRRVRRRGAARVRADVPVLLALRPRGHLHRLDHARRCWWSCSASSTARGAITRR